MKIHEVISNLRGHGLTQAHMQEVTDIPQARISKWSKPESSDSRSANDAIKLLELLQKHDAEAAAR